MAVTERLQRWNRPTRRERPPIAVFVAIASLIGGLIWIAALTPAVQPTLMVEPGSLMQIVFSAALIVGTVLGVRIAWDLLWFFSGLAGGFVLISAIDDPSAQAIGGAVLMMLGLVLLFIPSVRHYETKRLRLVIE